ncbi:unnamed protein product [Eruca vesicaria subsp. sativa]|uniref:Uncharacterized protein n=1 Tax=Eruca vesicaria subsp. sativa TaxID=29727 RepID=A0ABC8K514_ERUVS|nr:unnamed protein product [Eruca vesicaria subsp. sativa]
MECWESRSGHRKQGGCLQRIWYFRLQFLSISSLCLFAYDFVLEMSVFGFYEARSGIWYIAGTMIQKILEVMICSNGCFNRLIVLLSFYFRFSDGHELSIWSEMFCQGRTRTEHGNRFLSFGCQFILVVPVENGSILVGWKHLSQLDMCCAGWYFLLVDYVISRPCIKGWWSRYFLYEFDYLLFTFGLQLNFIVVTGPIFSVVFISSTLNDKCKKIQSKKKQSYGGFGSV